MQTLDDVLKTPIDERDEKWESEFLDIFPTMRLNIIDQQLIQGPEGFPYLMIETNADGSESFEQVLGWAYKTGVGLVVNPEQDVPDFVLPFGMIWHYAHFKSFLGQSKQHFAGSFQLKSGDQVEVGDPSEEYFPAPVRKLVREFLTQQGMNEPKVTVLKSPSGVVDLCFSLESLGDIPVADRNNFLGALSWFFPTHYSLALISEQGLPEFFPL